MSFSDERIHKIATEAGESVPKLVAYAKALRKVKMVADGGGRVTLNRAECEALVWGTQLLKEGADDAMEGNEGRRP